ncbi:MAG: hypothetical protein HAW61_02560 [Candidatus Portiera sp.]|nr:hypothetical protein [Portiera sp.]
MKEEAKLFYIRRRVPAAQILAYANSFMPMLAAKFGVLYKCYLYPRSDCYISTSQNEFPDYAILVIWL